VLDHGHQTFETSLLDAQEEKVLHMPGESQWPFVAAVGLLFFFFGMLVSHYYIAGAGAIVVAVGVIGWMWPTGEEIHAGEPA
jgi:cytochrome c oxidase subunit I+III